MRTDHRSVTGKKIQNPGRHARFLKHFHQERANDCRWFGWFHDHRVAGNECGRDHSAQNSQWKIPRRNDKSDAEGPVMLIARLTWDMLGESWPPDQPHLLSIETAEIHRLANVAIGFGPR